VPRFNQLPYASGEAGLSADLPLRLVASQFLMLVIAACATPASPRLTAGMMRRSDFGCGGPHMDVLGKHTPSDEQCVSEAVLAPNPLHCQRLGLSVLQNLTFEGFDEHVFHCLE
jgi:hypothetical protein